MNVMNRLWHVALALLLGSVLTSAQVKAPAPQPVPSLDGQIGPCSVQLHVTDPAGKPVYGAHVDVRIRYGFMGIHHLELQAGTNSDGQILFKGLPQKPRGPLTFHASEDGLEGLAVYDPAKECHAQHDIVLQKK